MTDVHQLSSDLVDVIAAQSPIAATFMGLPGFDGEWDDLGTAGAARMHDLLAESRQQFRDADPEDRWAVLAQRVVLEDLRYEIDYFERDEHLLDLASSASTLQEVREVFDIMDTESRAGWEAIISRLHGLPAALRQYSDRLDTGRRAGKVVAERQARAAIQQARNHAGDGSAFETLPPTLRTDHPELADLTAPLAAGVAAARRGFAELAEYLEETYLPAATPHDPVGLERYLPNAERYLGRSLDPHEAYEWGWGEVARLRREMEATAADIAPGQSIADVDHLLKTDPDRSVPRDEFVAAMHTMQDEALRRLGDKHFDVPPQIRELDARIAPPGGPLGAYYVQPSEDFSRRGCVWYAFGDEERIPLYDQISTAYHEGFPGHHLQCGVQVALSDRLSRYHRLAVWYPGYGEGWALYAERLMHELGFLDQPDYVFGMLAGQMLRACRVVIDIGSHLELPIREGQPFHPGEAWRYELGVEMLQTYALLEPDYAASEMNRYLGWPGQAISYKLGERAILELREEFRRVAGPDFDLKEFHRRVLDSGPVGLDLLRELVLDQ